LRELDGEREVERVMKKDGRRVIGEIMIDGESDYQR
jgi:hypothetical protein